MHNKQYFWQKGFDAFEGGKWIVAFNGKSWQAKAYQSGYEFAKARSLVWNDSPSEYQKAKLMAMVK